MLLKIPVLSYLNPPPSIFEDAYCRRSTLATTFKQASLALKEAKPTHCPEGADTFGYCESGASIACVKVNWISTTTLLSQVFLEVKQYKAIGLNEGYYL